MIEPAPSRSNCPGIVFSDLDGTLLDHTTYDWRAAQLALSALQRGDVPLVLASSKTAAEIGPIRRQLGFSHCPAIIENGAGILAAGDDGIDSDGVHDQLIATLNEAPAHLRKLFTGFHEWSVTEVAARTGLTEEQADLAMTRQYSEPGVLSGSAEDQLALLDWLSTRGIYARRGGRFLTFSYGSNKQDRMGDILDRLSQDGQSPASLALGDAPNDIEMLEAADRAVIVRNSAHDPLPKLAGERSGRITRTKKEGPAGWNRAVLDWLNTLFEQRRPNRAG